MAILREHAASAWRQLGSARVPLGPGKPPTNAPQSTRIVRMCGKAARVVLSRRTPGPHSRNNFELPDKCRNSVERVSPRARHVKTIGARTSFSWSRLK
eukprot:8063994-Pyramimonas_sp.AAC.1